MSSTRPSLQRYLNAALAENTQRAYASDVAQYLNSGRKLPATARQVANYLVAQAELLSPRTLQRRLAALNHWHVQRGYPSPVHSPLVADVRKGIERLHGKPAVQHAPLLAKDVRRLVKQAQKQSALRAARDTALLLLGFCGALRRSELAALQVEDIAFDRKGMWLHITRSKTDQSGAGQRIFIARTSGAEVCPVAALKVWLKQSRIEHGPIFRRIDRNQQVGDSQITAQSVRIVIKTLAQQAWGEEKAQRFSAHSLRSGFCTEAAMQGWNDWQIRQQSRHRSVQVLARYVRAQEQRGQGGILS
ncbi:integrase [Lampropedia aestuarii]|uniref:Integrase n=1 Tax=Lampropedia aestuarii TaxID=2562762 RepID=A0A4S5BFB2_9BURK|nr:site-specific integrase [Lampropedia aestuarii]THJ30910.1 integrase [Lampropedia aestuarii]